MTAPVALLCLHRVLPASRRGTADDAYFQRQTALELPRWRALLDWLVQRDAALPPRTLLDWAEGGTVRAERPGVILTFDDGYADVLEFAAPELSARRMAALLCVTTAVVSGVQRGFAVDHWYAALAAATVRSGTLEGPWGDPWSFDLGAAGDRARFIDGPEKRAFVRATPDEQREMLDRLRRALGVDGEPPIPRPLDAAGIAELAAAGWLLGAHGETHQLLPLLPELEAKEELTRSRAFFAGHGLPAPSILAYPDGATCPRTEALAREAGYTVGLALGSRFVTATDPLLRLPRLLPTNDPGWIARRLLPLFSTEGC